MQTRVITLVCALVVPITAGAQPVDTFTDLEALLERGADVAVTYGRQQQIRGRVQGLSPTSLTLVSEGRLLELDAAGITRIRQRWHDPTRDGALKGLAWGVVPLGAVYFKHMSFEGEFTGAGLLAVLGLGGLAGYMLGELVDARTTEMRDVYRVPRAEVAPLLSRDGLRGAALSISW